MTVAEALREAAELLRVAGVPDARVDAELLLSHLLDAPRPLLRASGASHVSPPRLHAYFALVERRALREPLQYILGAQSFMGHDFLCAPCALIPRMDTETLCEQTIMRTREQDRVLDLCTGTGAIIISVQLAIQGARAFASDLSSEALMLARKNAVSHGTQVEFRRGDLLSPFAGERFDVIVCNPPYIPTGELAALQKEVLCEPTLALDGGADGLTFFRRLAKEAPCALEAHGYLLCEMGDGQSDFVRALFAPVFSQVEVLNDLAGLPRVIVCRK